MADALTARVRNRQGLIFEGQVKAVSSINRKGPFDILPRHANFVCTIEKKLVLHRIDGKVTEINLEGGVMEVHHNQVLVFVGII